IVADPVIVGADAGELQRDLFAFEAVEVARHARIEDLDLDAVEIHVADARAGIPGPAPLLPGEVLDDLGDDALLARLAGGEGHADRIGLVAVENDVEAFLPGGSCTKCGPWTRRS